MLKPGFLVHGLDIWLVLFGLYRHQSMNKLKILVLAFPCTSRPYTYLGDQHGA